MPRRNNGIVIRVSSNFLLSIEYVRAADATVTTEKNYQRKYLLNANRRLNCFVTIFNFKMLCLKILRQTYQTF